MREAIARLLCSGLLLAALVACRPDLSVNGNSGRSAVPATGATEAGALTLTDATGTPVSAIEPLDRIVCLHLSCLDILAELDRKPIGMYGVLMDFATSPVYFGDRAQTFGQISGRGEPNLEQLLALNPHLIIGHQAQLAAQRETLAPIAPLYLLKVENYNDAIGAKVSRCAANCA